MTRTVSRFVIASFKLLFVVIAMTYLYPILGLVTYEPIVALCQVPEEQNLCGLILMRGVYVLSILVVSFFAGLLFPGDRWIVRLAAIIYISWCFLGDIHSEIYFATNISHGSLSAYAVISVTIQYALILFLTYWLSVPLHRFGATLRGRGKVEA